MALHPLAGKPAPSELLQNLPRLVTAYFTHEPDPSNPAHQVAFGTSGHRGSSVKCSFNEQHILAISQAICDYRRSEGIDGPLFIGMATHAIEGGDERGVAVHRDGDAVLVFFAGPEQADFGVFDLQTVPRRSARLARLLHSPPRA